MIALRVHMMTSKLSVRLVFPMLCSLRLFISLVYLFTVLCGLVAQWLGHEVCDRNVASLTSGWFAAR